MAHGMDDGITIELAGLNAAIGVLNATANGSEKVMKRANFRIATLIRDTSVEYSPRSPTVGDIRKATGRKMAVRKARGYSRPKPGGLERSIDFEATGQDASIFVSSNSEAGMYAFRIHEEKGITWQHRGIGTISKGSKADDDFIVRAIKDKTNDCMAIIGNEQDKILKSGGTV
jgi:hypothetical protein